MNSTGIIVPPEQDLNAYEKHMNQGHSGTGTGSSEELAQTLEKVVS